jgi:2-amino-4-hydroxy-6-hydroxymethyldihydropteridine diphosphokinase
LVLLALSFTNNYPYKSKQISNKTHMVTLGIGGNIGNVKRRFNKFFLVLQQDSRFHIIKTSPLLKNPPFGYLEQDDFLNALIVIKTNLSPIYLLNQMQRYENRFGRKRSFKDAPRTLDIDIIFYDKIQIKHKRLIIPHPNWKERDSIIIPLKFLNTTT